MNEWYLVLVGGEYGVLIDCCQLRKDDLLAAYNAEVVEKIENSEVTTPHCGLGCLRN